MKKNWIGVICGVLVVTAIGGGILALSRQIKKNKMQSLQMQGVYEQFPEIEAWVPEMNGLWEKSEELKNHYSGEYVFYNSTTGKFLYKDVYPDDIAVIVFCSEYERKLPNVQNITTNKIYSNQKIDALFVSLVDAETGICFAKESFDKEVIASVSKSHAVRSFVEFYFVPK